MNKPVLYQNSNGLQRSDAQQVLKEFSSAWKWRPDGRDTMLDVGCGSGNVTMDLLLPILPHDFERLVGCDLSDDMVNYARNKHIHPKISFEQFDLSIDVDIQPTFKMQNFDHITSFFCLMWVQNQKMAVQNLYKLLKPGGDLLVVFVAYSALYDHYKEQSQDNKWAEYMTDVDEFISPYQHSKDPAKEFRELLIDVGFTECKVEVREKCHIFNGIELVRNFSKSINPFIDRVPIQDQEKYLMDLVQRFAQNDDFHDNSETCGFAKRYNLMIAYARK